MKRTFMGLLLAAALLTTACSDSKVIDGVEYDTYGFLNETDNKNPDIEYDLVVGNVVWSVILSETIIAPIYFVGFDLWEPVGVKDHTKPIGAK